MEVSWVPSAEPTARAVGTLLWLGRKKTAEFCQKSKEKINLTSNYSVITMFPQCLLFFLFPKKHVTTCPASYHPVPSSTKNHPVQPGHDGVWFKWQGYNLWYQLVSSPTISHLVYKTLDFRFIVPRVNIKIAGKWMFIPLKMVLIGIDPYPCQK